MQVLKTTKRLSKFLFFSFTLISVSLFSCSTVNNVSVNEYIYEIHFIDVGQGDAILITTPGKILLVDGDPRNSGVTDYLDSLEIDQIDIVIGTHPHADHIGVLIQVFQDFDVGKVIDPGVSHTTITYNDYMYEINSSDITHTAGEKGMEWELSEDAYMKIIYPTSPSSSHLNNASIVARITLDNVVVLLTGDVEQEGEEEMLGYPNLLASNIFKGRSSWKQNQFHSRLLRCGYAGNKHNYVW